MSQTVHQLYKFQISGYEESHPKTYMLGLGTIDDKNQFLGIFKHAHSAKDLTEKADYHVDTNSDCEWFQGYNGVELNSYYSIKAVTPIQVTNISLVNDQQNSLLENKGHKPFDYDDMTIKPEFDSFSPTPGVTTNLEPEPPLTPQLYTFQIKGYEKSLPDSFMLGLGTIDDRNRFTGSIKQEDSPKDLTTKTDFGSTSPTSDAEDAWKYANSYNTFGSCSVAVTDIPIINITPVNEQQLSGPTYIKGNIILDHALGLKNACEIRLDRFSSKYDGTDESHKLAQANFIINALSKYNLKDITFNLDPQAAGSGNPLAHDHEGRRQSIISQTLQYMAKYHYEQAKYHEEAADKAPWENAKDVTLYELHTDLAAMHLMKSANYIKLSPETAIHLSVTHDLLYKFQVSGHEGSHPETYMLGLGTIENNQFTGTLKHESSKSDLTDIPSYSDGTDHFHSQYSPAGCVFHGLTVSTTSLPVTSISLVNDQKKALPDFPALSTTDKKELTAFVDIVTSTYPEVKLNSLTSLCTIASEMKKLTIQNANGALSDIKYNSLTDQQESQIKTIINCDLPGIKVNLPYDPKVAAIKLNISEGSFCNVPEIPKINLAIAPVPTKTATEIISIKR